MERSAARVCKVISAALCAALAGCAGGDKDASGEDGGSKDDADRAPEASADRASVPTHWCTEDDGAEFICGSVEPRGWVANGNVAWFIDGSFYARIEGKTSLWTMLAGDPGPTFVRSLDRHAFSLEHNADRLLWVSHPTSMRSETDLMAGAVYALSHAAGEPEVLVQGNVSDMVLLPDSLIVGRLDRLQRLGLDGSFMEDLVPIDNAYCPFAAWGNTVAWQGAAGCSTLWTYDLAGAQSAKLADIGFSGHLIVVNEKHIYWSTLTGALHRISLSGGPIEPVDSWGTSSLVHGAGWVYWSRGYGPSVIRRIGSADGIVEDFAMEKGNVRVLRVDDSYTYFMEKDKPSVSIYCIKRKAH